MKARILGPEEWANLEMLGEMPLLPHVLPENMAVVVVEEAGQVLGVMQVAQVTHFEGLWIKPEYRGNPGVMRALMRLATAIPQVRGECWVFGGAADDTMRSFNERLGGSKVGADFYTLPLRAW